MALDPPLLIAPANCHRARLEAVVGGEGEEFWVEANRVAHALEHDALEVVVQEGSGQSAECSERLDVATQEAVHLGVEAKAQEHPPRVAEHRHEAHQRTARLADLQVAEVSPVDLHLLTRQRAQAQEGFGRGSRAQGADQMAEVAALTGVATLAHHVEQPAGGERRVLLQGLRDEVAVGLEQTPAQRDPRRCAALLVQDPAHGVAVHVQLGRDGAHAPMLDLVQTSDPRGQLRANGHAGRSGSQREGAANPAAGGAVRRNRTSHSVVRSTPALSPTAAQHPRPSRATRWTRRRWSSCMQPVKHRPASSGNPGASLY